MLADEVLERAKGNSEKVLKMTFQGTKVTKKTIENIINQLVKSHEKTKIQHGEQSLKTLNKQQKKLDSIPVMNSDLKGLQKELRKFGVDYSVRQNKSEKNQYEIYFKGTDINQIQSALKDYTNQTLTQTRKKESIKIKIEKAIKKSKEISANKDQREKENKKERGKEER